MEAAAALRKARIDALRSLRRAEESGDVDAAAQHVFGAAVKRAYRTSAPPEPLAALRLADSLESEIKGLQERIVADDAARQEDDLDLTAIAPKRPNWDLRRDLEARQQRLARRTRQAVRTLLTG
ncbi:hypothetical protein MSPP1_002502 [Malassezia sp. CBS 17886]|nr:hypothetical protein MSPP1_002502 [Malassezia sp. CBS 17886]